jgi:hypothetical protein
MARSRFLGVPSIITLRHFTEEVFQRETGVLTEKTQVDLDADAATSLDANHATDESDFIPCQRDEESDLRIKRQGVTGRDEAPALAQVGELQPTCDGRALDTAIEEHRATKVFSPFSVGWCHAWVVGCTVGGPYSEKSLV